MSFLAVLGSTAPTSKRPQHCLNGLPESQQQTAAFIDGLSYCLIDKVIEISFLVSLVVELKIS